MFLCRKTCIECKRADDSGWIFDCRLVIIEGESEVLPTTVMNLKVHLSNKANDRFDNDKGELRSEPLSKCDVCHRLCLSQTENCLPDMIAFNRANHETFVVNKSFENKSFTIFKNLTLGQLETTSLDDWMILCDVNMQTCIARQRFHCFLYS